MTCHAVIFVHIVPLMKINREIRLQTCKLIVCESSDRHEAPNVNDIPSQGIPELAFT